MTLFLAVAAAPSCEIETGSEAAERKCERFLEARCDQFAKCGLATKPDCLVEAKMAANCSKAVSVADSYDACLADLGTQTCDAARAGIPDACKGVIKVEK
jgi:hypothetical protein